MLPYIYFAQAAICDKVAYIYVYNTLINVAVFVALFMPPSQRYTAKNKTSWNYQTDLTNETWNEKSAREMA